MAVPINHINPIDMQKMYEELMKDKEELVRKTMLMPPSMMNIVGSGQSHGIATPPFRPAPNVKAMNVLKARMDWDHVPFPVLHVAVGKAKVVIFIFMDNDEHVVIEDTSGLFPCDETVTKLRMLMP
jgi:hypothetical protein